jgi:hypothetical protein
VVGEVEGGRVVPVVRRVVAVVRRVVAVVPAGPTSSSSIVVVVVVPVGSVVVVVLVDVDVEVVTIVVELRSTDVSSSPPPRLMTTPAAIPRTMAKRAPQ